MKLDNKLSALIDWVKVAIRFYFQNDSCYICNVRNCQKFFISGTNTVNNVSNEYVQLPLCANCYACLPWRSVEDNVVELAWRNYDLYANCLISTYYQAEICYLVRRYKFYQAAYLAHLFGYILALTYWRYCRALETKMIKVTACDLTKIDYVSFVPLHDVRKLERSYDQAELLANNCALNLKLSCQASLVRIRATNRQSSLEHRAERLQNVKAAFEVFDRKLVLGKNILLIDDVVSTGASLLAATKALYDAGAYGVLCLALASNLNNRVCHYVDGRQSLGNQL